MSSCKVLPVSIWLLVGACTGDPSGPGTEATPDTPANGKPKPAIPPANPEIAWSKDGIWVMNADGSNQARVTPPDGWIGNPAWSPIVVGDSYQLAYSDIDTDTLWIVDISIVAGVPKGSAPRVLTTGGREPTWSPLGDEIAYLRPGPDGGAGIWIMDAAGTTRAPVYEPPASEGRTFMRPTWSGDGLALAFWEDRSPTSPDHKKILVVTRASRTAPWSLPDTVYWDTNPSAGNALDWAPRTRRLAFTAGQSGAALEILDLDNLAAGVDTVGFGARPSWSPDDRYLAYYSRGVKRLELATGAITTLARDAGCCRPAWRRTPPSATP
jgi:dipeptidyl aminopeptidase/acylaminoacyl peptidase